ncbi:MAG: hypothetical protein CL841_04355 [Crocinitomicaceae bacterium]|nr:hypothetical protein [Crocinitomicaceae bacterium]|tara:strand:+ start:690 stop:1130 length:441 start_codon:yes stop_codon:yes gene_type:complete
MSDKKTKKIILKQLEYPSKVLIAWREAIGGNIEFRDFLIRSPYKELGIFCFAILNDKKSRKWLLDNNYGHLLATIEGIEGKDSALEFLKKNGFDLLFHFARSADSWKDSQIWLQKKDKLLYAISLKIEYVKDEIELRNQDPHKLNP